MPSETGHHGYCLSRMIILLLAFVFLTACAATSTTIIEEEIVTNKKPMYTYKSIVIKDFELNRDLYTDAPELAMSQRDHLYARMPGDLSENIERFIKSRRSFQNVSRNGELTASTLLLQGRFTRLGRFRVSIVATLNDGATGQEVAFFRQTLWDVLDSTVTISDLAHEIADFINRIQYK